MRSACNVDTSFGLAGRRAGSSLLNVYTRYLPFPHGIPLCIRSHHALLALSNSSRYACMHDEKEREGLLILKFGQASRVILISVQPYTVSRQLPDHTDPVMRIAEATVENRGRRALPLPVPLATWILFSPSSPSSSPSSHLSLRGDATAYSASSEWQMDGKHSRRHQGAAGI
ncbi:hypothetical protein DAEQUDRAFT_51522 [Daedalea quercina L-15889]|uniref:Uncharacterized protein n=1 Tax=Daedalea quercina L-15889 TaxID=1314783 RepID=A0A165L9B0_9APHY|nr:hypothetical protein DAEQUDRAFT_51522 [Daedalea quercina L-15889]